MVIAIGQVPRLSAAISLTLGDAVHNFRGALDHLANAFVSSTGALPRKDTSFPILRVAPTSGKSARGLPNIAPGVAVEVRRALDLVQPYQSDVPDEHPMAMLHELDIRDKHRQLLVTLVGTHHVLTLGTGIEIDWFHGGPYSDGDEVLRLRWDSWRNFSDPEPYFDVAVGVVLREPGCPDLQMQRDPGRGCHRALAAVLVSTSDPVTRRATSIGAPPLGRLTTRPVGGGIAADAGRRSSRWAMRAMRIVSSIWASAKPMQLRAPPPNGTHARLASDRCSSVIRSKRWGSKVSASSQARGSRPARYGDGATRVPRRRR